MASEILTVPEERLPDVIRVIRAGLATVDVPTDVLDNLTIWCDEEQEYINRLKERGDENERI